MVVGMKVFAAIGVLVLLATVMTAGIVMAVQGSAWLLILSSLIYLILFARVGCTEA